MTTISILIYEIFIPILIFYITYKVFAYKKYYYSKKNDKTTNHEEKESKNDDFIKTTTSFQKEQSYFHEKQGKLIEHIENIRLNLAVVTEWLPNNTENPECGWVFSNCAFFLEENNCNILPLLPWYSNSKVEEILEYSDGIVFMGGMRTLNPKGKFEEYARHVMKYAKKRNIPVLGICQGFQLIITLEAEENILRSFKNTPARFQNNHFETNDLEDIKKYSLFTKFSIDDISHFTNRNVNLHYHNWGISYNEFNKIEALKYNYEVSTYGYDREDNLFINSIHHKRYPIHGIQYHFETGNVSFYKKSLNRNEEEVSLSQRLSKKILLGLKEEMIERYIVKDDVFKIVDDAKFAYLRKLNICHCELEYNEFYDLYGFKICKKNDICI